MGLGAGVGAGLGAGVGLAAGLGAGAAGWGGRRSAGSAAAGSAAPETRSGGDESTAGAGIGDACVAPALALRTAKAAPKANAAISAAIATRPRELAVIRSARASSSPERGIAGSW